MTLALAVAPATGAHAQVAFTDVTAREGIDHRAVYGSPQRPYVTDSGGSGAAWLDYDRDGRLDVAIANGLAGPSDRPYEATRRALAGDPLPESRRADGSLPRHGLWRGGNGFRAVGARAGFAASGWANAVVAGDLDDDGFTELLVTAIGPNVLYRNNGDGTFVRWRAGLEDDRWTTGAALVDWDRDGDLDVYLANYVDFDAASTATLGDGVCNYLGVEVFCGPLGLTGSTDSLLLNRGDGTFTPAPDPVDPEATFGFAVIAFDCDGVPGQEIYVANDSNINLLYRNRDGALEDLSLFSGAGFSGAGRPQAGMGIAAADFDDDSDLDLLVSNFQHDYNTLYENLGDCTFIDAAMDRGLASNSYPYMAWSSVFFDVDGDADADVFVANGHLYPQLEDRGLEPFGQRNQLYLNRLRESGQARFEEIEPPGLDVARSSRSAALGDYDDDGDLDLLVTQIDDRPSLLRNDHPAPGAFVRLLLRGRAGPRDAYGAWVTVVSGSTRQVRELRPGDGYLAGNDARLLFALPAGSADVLEIRWPSGTVTTLRDLAPGTLLIDEMYGLVARR